MTYYLHVNVKTFVPAFAAVKYLVSKFSVLTLVPPSLLRLHNPSALSTSHDRGHYETNYFL